MPKPFLKAEWRKLAMANYAVDKKLLDNYLPDKTVLDLWNNTCYVSLVGFMFLNTSVMGFKIPYHVHFEEVNLRFYVRYQDRKDGPAAPASKRGVVFIKEIVPRHALTWVANTFYQEHYVTLPMTHSWRITDNNMEVEYDWKNERWNSLKIVAGTTPIDIENGSEEEFITEHYWGYTKMKNGKTSEYGVEHPRWQVYPTREYSVEVDFGLVYGKEFDFLKNEKPVSVFLAEGSDIIVTKGVTL